jgi:transposase
MKPVLASSTGTGGDTVPKAFARPTHRRALLRVDLPSYAAYAALEPTTGESFCLYLPGMDRGCPQGFLEGLSEAYPHNHLLVVLDGAPSHRSEEIVCPENVSFLGLRAYSPELDPVERWFQEFRRELSKKAFETVELVQEALGQALLYPTLGGACSPTTAHRFLLVGGGRQCVVTSITRIGITVVC